MKNFYEEEAACTLEFARLGECYHLWTPENFQLIFQTEDNFKAGMTIIGICARLFPEIRILTFEWMSNHLHVTAASNQQSMLTFFKTLTTFLRRYFKAQGRVLDWDLFTPGMRKLESMDDVRNVIVYDNRNGYVVSPGHTPFTYPWGANRYWFNPDAVSLAIKESNNIPVHERRLFTHSHLADSITNLLEFEGYALPLSFCDIKTGEKLFRNASHYFSKISKSIEANASIAKEIGESVFYTDDELFSAVVKRCRDRYGNTNPSLVPRNAKLELAKMMRYDYGASSKQIQRMLRLDPDTLRAMGF